MVPAIEPCSALIVAHGAPSAPKGPERAVKELAGRVAEELPGWVVRGATLALPGALEAALAAMPDRTPLVYPLFMSDGWFVRKELPRRLRASSWSDCEILPPLGLDPGLPRLCLEAARAGAAAAGLAEADTALLLAAHGSPKDPQPRKATLAVADCIAAAGRFREVRAGFIDEMPFLAEAARLDAPAVCLPFFAGRAGHVEIDLPAALSAAAFRGPLLEVIGRHPGVPGVVVRSLVAQALGRVASPRLGARAV
jgi:sirohydrochlorin cobaltochelatase